MTSITRTVAILLISIGICAAAAAQDEALTPQVIQSLRKTFPDDAHTRAMRNALTSTSITDIAENRQIVADHNTKFSHKIKTKGISNQKASGRCWMFAGFNTIKPVVQDKLDLKEFEFSQVYLQFWDKLEKANCFLEHIIALRDRDLMDRQIVFLLKNPISDGGYWENFAGLMAKYGAIPKEAMAETASSENTRMMNKVLETLLRKDAVELRRIHDVTGSVKKMRAAKKAMLADVYRVLVLNLGQPPAKFDWRYELKKEADADKDKDKGNDEDKNEVEQRWSPLRSFTPQSFYKEIVGVNLDDYVGLADDPIRPKGGHYEIDLTQNIWDGPRMHYANVGIQVMRDVVVKTLLENRAVYFSADVSPDQDKTKGIMARNLYDYESVYNLDLKLTKTERLLSRDSVINHGMAFIGVDLRDGKPLKWLVENSWGSERGSGGLWTMYDDWFEDNVYKVIVRREDVPADVLKILEKPATRLPVWDPMW